MPAQPAVGEDPARDLNGDNSLTTTFTPITIGHVPAGSAAPAAVPAAQDGRPLRIVFLSHTGLSSVFRVGSHHLARELALLGHHVVHISNPISLAHVVMLKDAEFRRRARIALPLRLHRLDGASFAVPWSVFPLTPNPLRRTFTLGSTRLLMRRLNAAGFHRPDLMVIDQPLLEYLIRPINPRRILYRPTDVNLDPHTRTAEDRLMGRVAGVVATSGVVADELAARHPDQHFTVVQNGVQTAHFVDSLRPWADRSGVVYVGALDRRFDWPTVVALASSAPGERFDVFGPGGPADPGLPANVKLRGPVDYSQLPDLLSRYRVGLLPLSDEPTNDGRSPMKLYEYLAAGLNVLSRSTTALAASAVGDVHCYSDVRSAAVLLARLLANEPTGEGALAAATMDWSARARLVLQACTAPAERLIGAGSAPDHRRMSAD